MKKRFFMFSILLIFLITIYINQYLKLEYNVNIPEYIRLSSGYTKEELQLIEEAKPLVYGGNINEPPLGIYYEENGQYLGLVVDYINALSIELGTTIVSEPMVWNEALSALSKGRTDLCDMIPSKERAKNFSFSKPIYNIRGLVVVKSTSTDIREFKDLEGKRIGVQRGDYALDFISSSNINCEIVYTDNLAEALRLLEENKVEGVVGDEPVIRYHLNELVYIHDYKILEKPLYDTSCSFAVPREKEKLLGVVNKAIFNMRKNGTLDKIETKWAGHTQMVSKDKSIEKLKLSLVASALSFMILGYIVFLWNRSLKFLIDSRTRELQLTKNELQITFDGMDNFLAVVGDDLRIKNINRSFLNYLSLEKEGAVNRAILDIPILSEFQKIYDRDVCEALNSRVGNENQKTYELRRKGRIFTVSIYPLKEPGNILFMITDITKTRLQEEKLIQSSKMESIGQLAAGVAHELRNPLGIIRNSTYILDGELKGEDKVTKMAINAIDNSVNRASKIIDNLLNFSRLTQDRNETVELGNLGREITELYKKSLKGRNIEINVICNEKIFITTNSQSLRHILMNLIQNSIDAMDNGKIEVLCNSVEGGAEIIVRDNGSGIDKDVIERIFDPFYTTKPPGKGTGLGLYIAYSEAKRIRGSIGVESELGVGTAFKVEIPNGGDEDENRTKASAG